VVAGANEGFAAVEEAMAVAFACRMAAGIERHDAEMAMGAIATE
jgi:hypothetical protein